ncbi:MAG: hypothetical protein U1E39_06160 [Planctomycetota bacterium]
MAFLTVSWMALRCILEQHRSSHRRRSIDRWVDWNFDQLRELPPLRGESPAAKFAAALVRALHSVRRWREEDCSAELVEVGVILVISAPFWRPSAAELGYLGYNERTWVRVVAVVRHRLRRDHEGPEE